MIKNYLKVAWRNLVKNKVSSFINIGGLAVGMAVTLLIGLWIWDELSFNRSFRYNYSRIAQVRTRITDTRTGEIGMNGSLQVPMVTELKAHYKNNFKHIIMTSWDEDDILSAGDKKLSRTGLGYGPWRTGYADAKNDPWFKRRAERPLFYHAIRINLEGFFW